jgi:hypothetical protein
MTERFDDLTAAPAVGGKVGLLGVGERRTERGPGDARHVRVGRAS